MRPLCEVCDRNLAEKRGDKFRKKCSTCSRGYSRKTARTQEEFLKYEEAAIKNRRPWLFYKKDHCENADCKWMGTLMPSQLHVDHIDGDKKNNDPSNFMTLCACCHAEKTYLNQEYLPTSKRGKNAYIRA